jgi:hypothetical protein
LDGPQIPPSRRNAFREGRAGFSAMRAEKTWYGDWIQIICPVSVLICHTAITAMPPNTGFVTVRALGRAIIFGIVVEMLNMLA